MRTHFLTAVVVFISTVLLIYLTPLKWLNLVEPKVEDVLSQLFYQELQKNPEKILFIDVRPSDVYEKEHVTGSINMPLHTLYDERYNLPKSGKKIVLICGGGRASGVGYGYLEHYGFHNLQRIAGGIEAWKEAGLPTTAAFSPEESSI
ncbi:MAG: Rhodanese-related sulfurtransferase [Parcubacteria group bacterium Gr01-1014_48]|nr:MAG: Rhodanese-related sulfurtransferase [Parcubacteria group bacterium Greene0416_14]TSC72814.1 MAG: Rhodanese-related sulfurtransferase [Parcubacteria group bacterium Gr01-1014_48]TSC99691.1 MAG: Rhodanese-related sulfurtransferase [Parcubacteria group bacterium Greene1014_15]TSD07747.1 MAG: Rhodanese-related sulfurtransferase [Parcubacteria group bacterium Greene0714_4]